MKLKEKTVLIAVAALLLVVMILAHIFVRRHKPKEVVRTIIEQPADSLKKAADEAEKAAFRQTQKAHQSLNSYEKKRIAYDSARVDLPE
jgi:hypothetical protein